MTDQEKNEAVARKLGWRYHKDLKPICWQVPPPGKAYLRGVPDFCHSIEAAWKIVKWLHEKGDQHKYNCIPYGFRLEHHCENSEDKWVCELPLVAYAPPYEEMNSDISAEADTAPMAICLAFLKLPMPCL